MPACDCWLFRSPHFAVVHQQTIHPAIDISNPCWYINQVADERQDLTLEHLRLKCVQLDCMETKLVENTRHVGLLADGILSLRNQVSTLGHELQTLALASVGHGSRLAEVEDQLTTIARHLGIQPPQA
jgi:hypothetical protein